ncbi:unnamed protein product [Staurois parvus]|uniref:FAST kinase domain-containing protein 4 n=1 Tax=Staurois parvus TaxID=386267 RepID=A0ABN9G7R4_9NEOB|nr:unnamed protein product [Staurois parvus]
MAVRLIQRVSRLLAAPVSFHPPPASAPSECMRLCQYAPCFPCQAALHTSSLRFLVGDLLETSWSPPEPSQSPLTSQKEFLFMLQTLSGVEELLEISRKPNLSANRKVMIIQEIAQRQDGDNGRVLEEPRFQDLLYNVTSQIQDLQSGSVIRLLKSLYGLGLDRNDDCFQSAMVEAQWRLHLFSIGGLAQLSSYIPHSDRTKEENRLLDELVKQVELRWSEIKEPRTVVTLISSLGSESNSFKEKLEDKVLELAAGLTPEQSRKVITALAAWNRRTLPVLWALSFHLTQYSGELSPPVILDLAFAFAKLNYFHMEVLQKMATDLMPRLTTMKQSNIALMMRSFTHLRYSNQPFCEAVAQVCLQRSEFFHINQLFSVLLSFAFLNFQPRQSEEFFNMIHQRFGSEFDSLSWKVQLDTVWSLCMLGHVTTTYFQKILNPEFYSQVLGEQSEKSVSRCRKLLQINASAQLESPDYPGPLLPIDVLQTLQSRVDVKTGSTLQCAVSNALKKVFPDPGTCNFNVRTIYGWNLDGEVVLDSDLEALALQDFEAPHNPQSGGTQPLPEGARRFAIVVQEFAHFAFHEKEVLGRGVMTRRHLRAAGFLVVEVPYYDWKGLRSEQEKESFLKDRIRNVMAEDMVQ